VRHLLGEETKTVGKNVSDDHSSYADDTALELSPWTPLADNRKATKARKSLTKRELEERRHYSTRHA
jgi:hypothetical protein